MNHYEHINRTAAKELRLALEEHVKPWAEERGLRIGDGRKTQYDDTHVDISVSLEIPEANDKAREDDYNLYKDMYGIKAPYGFQFTHRGIVFTVSELNHKASKNKIIYDKSDGTRAHSPVETLNMEYIKSKAY